MTREDIFALMDRFEAGTCTTFRLTTSDGTLELTRTPLPTSRPADAVPDTQPLPAQPRTPAGPCITAPVVGTFYAAPAPDQPPFVQVGDTVKEGQTVCLLEAMKMMSEVPAPCDLVVEEILCKDGELLDFGAPILRYRAV